MSGGKSPRGRPRKRWKEMVEGALSRHDMFNLESLREEGIFLDRVRWRMLLAPTCINEAYSELK